MMTNKYCQALAALRSKPAHELKEVGDQWRTPDLLFWGINALFGPLVLDLFADDDNAKCPAWYTAEDNALTQNWSERLGELGGAAFANPPYSRSQYHDKQAITGMTHIMNHTMDMREIGGRYIYLVKSATSETWWPEDADHIMFIRGRIMERYYWTPQGGADGDYVVWAKEVPGVTRAWTYRHWMGTGTVGVLIASSDLINPLLDDATVAAAQAHIEPLAPVAGSDLYVFKGTPKTVNYTIDLNPDTPEIRAAVEAELRSFLLRDGHPKGTLELSRTNEAISIAAGEHSHKLLSPTVDTPVAKNELAVLGVITWV